MKRNWRMLLILGLAVMICGCHYIPYSLPQEQAEITPDGSAPLLGEDEIRKMAQLKVPGAGFEWLDMVVLESGTIVYQGKMDYQEFHYYFEIDARAGTFLVWEFYVDTIPYHPAASPLIDGERAQQIAMRNATGASFVTAQLIVENTAFPYYQGQLAQDNTVYDYLIDAVNGRIIRWRATYLDGGS